MNAPYYTTVTFSLQLQCCIAKGGVGWGGVGWGGVGWGGVGWGGVGWGGVGGWGWGGEWVSISGYSGPLPNDFIFRR